MNPNPPPSNPWLPIAEAPRDGMLIEIKYGDSGWDKGYWSQTLNGWFDDDGDPFHNRVPTHFRHLPTQTEKGTSETPCPDLSRTDANTHSMSPTTNQPSPGSNAAPSQSDPPLVAATPRTDAMFARLLQFRGSDLVSEFYHEVAAFERELLAANAKVEELTKARDEWSEHLHRCGFGGKTLGEQIKALADECDDESDNSRDLRAKLAEVARERDEARNHMNLARVEADCPDDDTLVMHYRALRQQLEEAKARETQTHEAYEVECEKVDDLRAQLARVTAERDEARAQISSQKS